MKDRSTATEPEDSDPGADEDQEKRAAPKIDGRVVARTAWKVTKVLGRVAWRSVASIAGFEAPARASSSSGMIEQLRIWDPPSFCLALFW